MGETKRRRKAAFDYQSLKEALSTGQITLKEMLFPQADTLCCYTHRPKCLPCVVLRRVENKQRESSRQRPAAFTPYLREADSHIFAAVNVLCPG